MQANPFSDSYRKIPTFGSDTIRRFTTNVSELKKLAARNFEDLLQVGSALRPLSDEYLI